MHQYTAKFWHSLMGIIVIRKNFTLHSNVFTEAFHWLETGHDAWYGTQFPMLVHLWFHACY